MICNSIESSDDFILLLLHLKELTSERGELAIPIYGKHPFS